MNIEDRRKAIKHLIYNKKENDILMILGRGDDRKYICGEDVSEFSDKEFIEELLMTCNSNL